MPTDPFPVTLQINLAPGDHRLARQLLAHQADFWRRGVGEILLTVDIRPKSGEFDDEWRAARHRILDIANAIPGARVLEVEYTREARHAVSDEFFGDVRVPSKDWRGGPYFAWFFGLHAARHDFVLHAEPDMFFGGDGLRWLETALPLYNNHPELLFTAPLPGPPAPDGRLKQLPATRTTLDGVDGYELAAMSTRVFLFSRTRFRERIAALRPRAPALRARASALLDGFPGQELPENLLTEAMQRTRLKRFDFAGPAPGCWTLHPPYRSEDFYQKIPELLARIEKPDLPAAQLGDHDFNESLVDWNEALVRMSRRRWWHRLRDRFFDGTE
jgi:hypothetical protein